MSIVAYIGRPGAGKSYGVVENVILPAFEKSRIVATNIPLKLEALKARFDEFKLYAFGPEDYDREGFWSGIPAGAVVVLDEVWRAFPAGTTQDKIPQERREFLAEHRHQVGEDGFSTEVVLVTQDLKQIAASVRPLIDKVYVAEKLDAVGATRRYRVDIYQGSDVKKDRFIRSVFGSYKPEVFQYYQSHTKADSAVAGVEERPDNRSVIWKNPWLAFGVPLSLVFFIGAVWWLATFKSRVDEKAEAARAAQSAEHVRARPVEVVGLTSTPVAKIEDQAPKNVPIAAPAPEPIKLPQVSKRWRIVGMIASDDMTKAVVFLAGPRGRNRRISGSYCSGDLDLECRIDGELVYRWSGPSRQPGAMASMTDAAFTTAGASVAATGAAVGLPVTTEPAGSATANEADQGGEERAAAGR